MTTFSSLPVEIQRQCVNYLDTAALKSMRLTSQDIKDIATEALFQVATLTFTEESAETLSTLIKNNEIRRYIRKVRRKCESLVAINGSYVACEEANSPSSVWIPNMIENVWMMVIATQVRLQSGGQRLLRGGVMSLCQTSTKSCWILPTRAPICIAQLWN